MCSGPWLRASVLYIGINYLREQEKKEKNVFRKKKVKNQVLWTFTQKLILNVGEIFSL